VGSELRSDDAAGLLVAAALRRAFPRREDLLVVEGSSAPENLTGPILEFRPTHLVVVDCADLGEAPGSLRSFPEESIVGFESSTHSLPLGVILSYLRMRIDFESIVIGIQPASLAFDGRPSREVRSAARLLSSILIGEIRAMGRRTRGSGLAGRPGGAGA
jgi:hydrogenase 3 maturation protease